MRGRGLLSAVTAVALGIAGLLSVFVLPGSDGLPLTIDLPVENSNNLYLVITTERAVGFTLVFAASLTSAAVAGRSAGRQLGRTATQVGLYVAALAAGAGALLVFVLPSGGGVSFDFGSFNDGGGLPALFFLTFVRSTGLVLMWGASLFVAFVIGQSSKETRTRT